MRYVFEKLKKKFIERERERERDRKRTEDEESIFLTLINGGVAGVVLSIVIMTLSAKLNKYETMRIYAGFLGERDRYSD